MKTIVQIIGIISSPHRNGFSATLTRKALNAAKKEGANIEEIYLPDFDIQYCRGCLRCVSGDKCALNDDLNTLRNKLEKVEGIIISSPTYGLNPNALMMNFIQRIGIYAVYRSSLAKKYIVGISTAGAIGQKKVAKFLTNITDGLFKVGYRTGVLGAKVGDGSLNPRDIKKAESLGKKLVKDIKIQKKYRFQKLWIKFLSAVAIKPTMRKNLRENKTSSMQGAYNYLLKMREI